MQKFFVLIALSLTMAVGGWSQDAKSKVQDPPKPAANPAADLPAADSPSMPVDPKSYRVGPEDVIAGRAWGEPGVSGQVLVAPELRI